jgi:hypothetical protein
MKSRKSVKFFAVGTGSIAAAVGGRLESQKGYNRCEIVRVMEGLTVNGQGSARPSNLALS